VSKGPQAFRTISEVAQELALPQHVLRFWETRFSSIRPMKRGGGRRYYRPDDIDLLRGIRALLYGEGYTIRGVQRILKEQGPRFVIAAARGEVSGLQPPSGGYEIPEDDVGVAEDDGGEDFSESSTGEAPLAEAALHIEPTFDPREFRANPTPSINGSRSGSRLASGFSADEIHRLQATLTDLLELKRLLDQGRD
jgi:DNA-binding transcriptional MerR regulator